MPAHVLLAVAAGLVGCGGDKTETMEEPTEPGTQTPEPTTECEDSERDCAGVCFGESVEDDCGQCDDLKENDCVQEATVEGSWSCGDGVSCQDVYELDMREGAEISIEVTDVTGSSDVRISLLAPDTGAGSTNFLVGTSVDLSCGGPDEDEAQQFKVSETGTWRLAVGRDTDTSGFGNTGTYTLNLSSELGIGLREKLFADDQESRADGVRCGSEYRFPGTWVCDDDESCQDTFEVIAPEGMALDLAVTDLKGNSVPGLALYAPGDDSGDVNLLTNTTGERVCGGPDKSDAPPPVIIEDKDIYTVALTRVADGSTNEPGRYVLAIGGDDFFRRPSGGDDDVDSQAGPGVCDWTETAASGWTCPVGSSCQDVYDLALEAGSIVSARVVNVTGSSVVRFAMFGPGQPLSGTNSYTGSANDLACWSADQDATPSALNVPESGTYRVAVGRDDAGSTGETGTYELQLTVSGGYATPAVQTVDDLASEAQGTTCF